MLDVALNARRSSVRSSTSLSSNEPEAAGHGLHTSRKVKRENYMFDRLERCFTAPPPASSLACGWDCLSTPYRVFGWVHRAGEGCGEQN